MTTIEEKKQKLEQKKARVLLEEAKLKIKEEKMRTKSLIEKGSLITKADLDYLPNNALYGGLLFLKKQIENNENIISKWIVEGNTQLNAEKKDVKAIIIKFDEELHSDTREFIRSHGLRFNSFRKEWCGRTSRLKELQKSLGKIKYELEIIEE
tara:strand:- start:219 stop:677 length:459 start_codon:yes stop_codon:yes gene_type:complete